MHDSMLRKLDQLQERINEIQNLLVDSDTVKDIEKYTLLNKEFSELKPIVEKFDEYNEILESIKEANEIIDSGDKDLKSLAEDELKSLQDKPEKFEQELKLMLLPKDSADDGSAFLEIRAGAGGDEASIFAGDLYRMYTSFAQSKGWSIELVDIADGTSGGYKEIIFNVNGDDVYGQLKFESGVHRVQRVPQTETQGRVHTSAATVIVLPEAEEFDIELKDSDIRKDTYCSSGPGGQSVNTTYSAVRLTHIPTGVVAQCQDQKSQHKNYDKALKVLRSRIYEMELQKKLEEDAKNRKTMVSSGDRSAKIRTYNYPQGRVTEHRIGLTLYDLPKILDGDVSKLIDEIQLFINTERLKEAGEV